MILRRYLKAEAGIRTLADLRFRIGRIHEVNDPSEFLANYKFNGRTLPDSWHRFLTSLIKNKNTLDKGILCFSAAEVNNELMWGHYAEGGRGICVEVESDLLGFRPDALFPVEYAQPPEVEIGYLLDAIENRNEDPRDIMVKVLSTKSSAWKYEDERRAFMQLLAEYSTMDPITKEVSFYHVINRDAIRTVYVGAAAAEKTVFSVADCIRHHRLPVELKIMVLDPINGGIRVEGFDADRRG